MIGTTNQHRDCFNCHVHVASALIRKQGGTDKRFADIRNRLVAKQVFDNLLANFCATFTFKKFQALRIPSTSRMSQLRYRASFKPENLP